MKLKIKSVLNIKKQYTREMKFIININDTTPYNDILSYCYIMKSYHRYVNTLIHTLLNGYGYIDMDTVTYT